ncbi:putative transcriptional regulator [Hartmannibacter diazotrophicus]|uniref:Putative transcriptional regulator n=1 Tax=Hartmannibacter diazotrophicus TaxID=1482074 RepID=A0A2C9D256_9HYPH|nr:AlpA family phage regulatory protein [Hartmannibacter diazotrophicus]SON54330.1 putative transcriptional regulator [Hartmannibacter diazotrophicus]
MSVGLSDPPRRLLRVENVTTMLNVSRATFYRMLKNDETFPKPVKMGKLTMFSDAEINDWIGQKLNDR